MQQEKGGGRKRTPQTWFSNKLQGTKHCSVTGGAAHTALKRAQPEVWCFIQRFLVGQLVKTTYAVEELQNVPQGTGK